MFTITGFLIAYAKKQWKARVMSIITSIVILLGNFVILAEQGYIGCSTTNDEPEKKYLFCESILNDYEIYDYYEMNVNHVPDGEEYIYFATLNNRQVYLIFTCEYVHEYNDTVTMMTAFDAMSGFVLCFDYTFDDVFYDFNSPGLQGPPTDIYPTIINLGIDKYYETGELKIIPGAEELSICLHACFIRAVDIFSSYNGINPNQDPVKINVSSTFDQNYVYVEYVYNDSIYNKQVRYNVDGYDDDVVIEYDYGEIGYTISYSIYHIIENRIRLEENRITYHQKSYDYNYFEILLTDDYNNKYGTVLPPQLQSITYKKADSYNITGNVIECDWREIIY
jgi:hypothetical protein